MSPTPICLNFKLCFGSFLRIIPTPPKTVVKNLDFLALCFVCLVRLLVNISYILNNSWPKGLGGGGKICSCISKEKPLSFSLTDCSKVESIILANVIHQDINEEIIAQLS